MRANSALLSSQPFEVIERTPNIGIELHSETLKGIFEIAGTGMMSLISPLENIEAKKTLMVHVESTNTEELMVDFLNELLYILDTDHFGWKWMEVELQSNRELSAVLHGEKLNTTRHVLLRDIQAATYHQLKIERGTDNMWHGIINFDV